MSRIGRIHDDYLDPDKYFTEGACEVCHRDPAECICEVCPECGEQGNPNCAINVRPGAHSSALALMDTLSVDSLYRVYRAVYRAVSCGPSIGFLIHYTVEQDNGEAGPGGVADKEVERWIYCDDLAQGLEGTPWRLIREHMPVSEPIVVVKGASVGSIVEGVDYDCDTIKLEGDDFTPDAFWKAVEAVNEQADQIWKETHGCEDCFDYPEGEQHPIDPECKTCHGQGAII